MPANYLALADSLEAEIVDLGPDVRLPSEHQLCSTNRVSRVTARGALQELERRHLVRRTRGSGTFTALRIPYPIRPGTSPSWSRIVLDAGHTPSYRLIDTTVAEASRSTARALDLDPGDPVLRIERIGSIDGQAATHQLMHFRPDCFGSETVDAIHSLLETHPSTAALLAERFGVELERLATRAELQPIDAKRADAINLVGRPMAWHTETVNRSRRDQRPLEHTKAWLRADSFRVFMELGPTDNSSPFDPHNDERTP